ncbi:MAG: hypothetical protein OXF89_16605 [Rhodospirillaceae bacterium]|nr:hypothetical protein [Rhodospirillaceae bacterium]MCY4066531.1 hypothetical protein [Rhodospirillaceae bacterium]
MGLLALFVALLVLPVDSPAKSRQKGMLRELREIKFYGSYYAADPLEIKLTEEYYRKRGVIREGESLADSPQLKHKLEYLGKERFRTSRRPLVYCYGKILDKDRKSAIVFDPDLRVRMYDRVGNLLAEDVLRDNGSPENRKSFLERRDNLRLTVAYLPYFRNGDVILRVVRLKGEKEIVLDELKGLNSLEDLQNQELRHKPYGWRLGSVGYRLYLVDNKVPYEYELSDLGLGDLYCHM